VFSLRVFVDFALPVIVLGGLGVLWYRYDRFSLAARGSSEPELRRMRRYSAGALGVFMVSQIGTFLRNWPPAKSTTYIVLTLLAAILASLLDQQAERIRRRHLPSKATEKQLVEAGTRNVITEAREKFGILGELWAFMRVRKKWWLGPIMLMLALLGLLVVFTQGSAVAPFIYTLF